MVGVDVDVELVVVVVAAAAAAAVEAAAAAAAAAAPVSPVVCRCPSFAPFCPIVVETNNKSKVKNLTSADDSTTRTLPL